jgi:hypothetical protein
MDFSWKVCEVAEGREGRGIAKSPKHVHQLDVVQDALVPVKISHMVGNLTNV